MVLLDRLNEELCYFEERRRNETNDTIASTAPPTSTIASVIADTFQGELKSEVEWLILI